MGAFEALLELLNDIPPATTDGGAPLAVRTTSLGWKLFTRSEVVTALRLMAASSGVRAALGKNRGGHPVRFARHFGITNSTSKKMDFAGVYMAHTE